MANQATRAFLAWIKRTGMLKTPRQYTETYYYLGEKDDSKRHKGINSERCKGWTVSAKEARKECGLRLRSYIAKVGPFRGRIIYL